MIRLNSCVSSTALLNHQRGASLIEAMVGITIGLVIMSGVVALSAQISRTGLDSLKLTRLNQELRTIVDVMSNDIQRAGHVELWTGGTSIDDITNVVDIIDDFGVISIPDSSCIIYQYDLDQDGVKDETFGFRYVNADNTLDMRNDSDDATNCIGDTWQQINSDNVEITAFTVAFDSFDDPSNPPAYCNEVITGVCSYLIDGVDCETAGDVCFDRRKIAISITGQLTDDPTTSLTLNAQVKVRNDHYYTVD